MGASDGDSGGWGGWWAMSRAPGVPGVLALPAKGGLERSMAKRSP